MIHIVCSKAGQWCVKCREREKTCELYHSSYSEKRPDWSQGNGQQKLIHKSYVQLTNFFFDKSVSCALEVALNIILQSMYVFSEEKQEILKLPNGENQEQSIPWWVKQVAYILFA